MRRGQPPCEDDFMDTSLLKRDTPERQLRHATGELHRQLSAGLATQAEMWLQKFPDVASDEELALELIYSEYVVRESLGQRPVPEEYYARFPALRERLQRLFEVDAMLQKGVDPQTSTVDFSFPSYRSRSPQPPTLWKDGQCATPLGLPAVMGDFQFVDRLGGGGMGVVYLARQLSLQRMVALKIIREDIAGDDDVHERFLREARIVARLEHPHIVRIHEAGEYEGRLFLALEYVSGGTLRTLLQGKLLAPREAAQLVETMARTIHFAHQQNVIHRDLKPANILLAHKSNQEAAVDSVCLADLVPKITDFGLAVQLSGQDQLTSLGRIVGTPCYMAPEQASGREGWITPLVDVYALGVILYEALVGRPPFASDSDLETLRLVTQEEAVPPSRLQPKLPRDLEVICLKCLEKEPRRRYHSAEGLADDLQRFLRQEPIHARPTSGWEKAAKWMRRHPARTALVSVCVLATLLLGLVVGTYTYWLKEALTESDQQRQLAEDNAAKANASAEAASKRKQLARQALDAMTSQVVEDWLLWRPNLEPAQLEFLAYALKQYELFAEETGQDEEGRAGVAEAYLRVGKINELLGHLDRSEHAITQATDLFAGLRRDFPDRESYRRIHANSLHHRGIARQAMGEWLKADEDFRAAEKAWRGLVAEYPAKKTYQVHLATVITNHSVLLQRQGQLAEAVRLSTESLALWDRYLQPSPRDVAGMRGQAQALRTLGAAQRRLRRFQDAETSYRQAFEVTARLWKHDKTSIDYRSEFAYGHLSLALVFSDTGKNKEAEKLLRAGLAFYNGLVEERPNVLDYRHSRAKLRSVLGQELTKLRKYPEAEKIAREALAELEQLHKDYEKEREIKTTLGGCLTDLGDALQEQSQPQAAEACYTRAEGLLIAQLERESRHEDSRRHLLRAYRGLGKLLERENRPLDEAAMWQRAQPWMEEPFRTGSQIEQALALLRAEKREEAAALAEVISKGQLTAISRFTLATLHARLATTNNQAVQDKHADRIHALLTVPETKALFQQRRYLQHLEQNNVWDAVRQRNSFQQLLQEVKQKK